MPSVHKQSWFWSAVAFGGLVIGGISAHSRQTVQFEAAIVSVNNRVASLEASAPRETRWIVDQQTNLLNEWKGDIAEIKGSIRKIELTIARAFPGGPSLGLANPHSQKTYE